MGYMYKLIKCAIDNQCELHIIGKRRKLHVDRRYFEVGGLYFVDNGLYRVVDRQPA